MNVVNIELSIIIPAYRAEKTLVSCLDCLCREVAASEMPEIVVVNSSQPGIDDEMQRRFPAVRFIQSNGRLLPGAARNLGVEHAGGRCFVFLDADALPQPGWLARVRAASTAPDSILTGGALVNGQPENSAAQVNHIFEYRDFLPQKAGGPRRFLPAGNLVCSRAAFNVIGPFSDSLSGCEDVLFGERAKKSGYVLIFDPAMAVIIMNRTTLSDVFRHAFRLGLSAGYARRAFSLTGSWIRWCPPALPGLMIYRWFRLLSAVWSYDAFQRHQSLNVMLGLKIAIVLWSAGFARGLWGRNLSGRNDSVNLTG